MKKKNLQGQKNLKNQRNHKNLKILKNPKNQLVIQVKNLVKGKANRIFKKKK